MAAGTTNINVTIPNPAVTGVRLGLSSSSNTTASLWTGSVNPVGTRKVSNTTLTTLHTLLVLPSSFTVGVTDYHVRIVALAVAMITPAGR